jgi:hypothetical protein
VHSRDEWIIGTTLGTTSESSQDSSVG